MKKNTGLSDFCKSHSILATRIRGGIADGRFGWCRIGEDVLERSQATYDDAQGALWAAMDHYGLVREQAA